MNELEKELISIIVPVYNSAKYLSACLDSLLSQSYNFFEVILVDDGSIDNSGQICDAFEKKDERIKVFHQVNSGVSHARNVGLSQAQGKWVVFCDSDDEFLPDTLDALMEKVNISDAVEMVIAGYTIYNEKNEVTYAIDYHDDIILDRNMGMLMMYKPLYCPYHGYICSKLYLREILEKNSISFNEGIFYNEDRLFATQYISKINGSIVYSTRSVYKYFVREGVGAMSTLNKNFNYKFVTDFDAFILMYECVRNCTNDSKLIEIAKSGILSSYYRIKRMMNDFGIRDVRLKYHFIYNMLITGCYWYRLRERFFNILSLH